MSSTNRRLFAVIPAAGRSRRMGQPKLLLPFGETTVIGRLIEVLQSANIADIYVLARPDDQPLVDEVERCGATIIQPKVPPPEMRVSVEHLLEAVQDRHTPTEDDGWLLIPGDHPLVTRETLDQLLNAWQDHRNSINLPVHDGRRGHPTIFPWSLAARVPDIPTNVGVNHLLKDRINKVHEVPVDDSTIHLDLDTPADYESALQRFNN